MKNKSLLAIFLLVLLLVLNSCGKDKTNTAEKVTVFSDFETEYTLITAEGASDEANALCEELFNLSGAFPRMFSDASPETECEILIGDTNRKATADFVKILQEEATTSAFHFLIAEQDKKIIILSDCDIGYIYAIDYLKTAYINDDEFSIPSGSCDLKEIIWDEYYCSDLYYDRLAAEADKDRFEKNENSSNENGDNEENNTIMTVQQVIEDYKNKSASFNTQDFGNYKPVMFTSADIYPKPTVYPSEAHPRVLFTENSVQSVKNNITAEENAVLYKKYIALSDAYCDGKFAPVTGNMTHNYDADVIAKIEAKAFRYAMTGEELYGYQAIYAIKNAMLSINLPHTVGEWARSYGQMLYVLACVYDWCYDLMTEEDKIQLLSGGVNLVGWHLEMVCRVGADNKAPIGQGTVYGHGAEAQILVQYLSFAIACYNEAPEIYELVAGRVLNDYVEAQNYLFQSNSHWEGVFYGAWRSDSTLMANILINKMTDGKETPFTEKIEYAVETMIHYIRPDGQPFRIGDVHANGTVYDHGSIGYTAFYAASLYKNSYLKSFAYEALGNFSKYSNETPLPSPVMFLAINDPDVSYNYNGIAPLTATATYPHTGLFARNTYEGENAFAIYMTMPENYAASHAHMECGSFQIYYKGALASDSGAYTTWGDEHHMGYTMQTVSSNSLLIYNPALKDTINETRPTMVYSGGQSIAKSGKLPNTLAELLKHDRLGQCTSLGIANVERNGQYLYSYLGGDMTNAYDAETVDEVTRYMFAVATGNSESPLVFITFDRITSDDASYRKSALIHVQEKPTLTSDGFAIITDSTDGGTGKMIVQSVGFDTKYTVIGGEGKEFWIPGVDANGNYSLKDGYNIPSNAKYAPDSIAEDGWGRIEISPENAEKTNHMLTVMYVTDTSNTSAPEKAENIVSDKLCGTMIFGKAVLFPENEKLLTEEASFTLTEQADCFVAGVCAGSYEILMNDTVVATANVEDGTNILTFYASTQGTYTIKLTK